MTWLHPRFRHREVEVALAVQDWLTIVDAIERDHPATASLIEMHVSSALGLPLRPPDEDGPSQTPPKGGA